MRKYFLITLIVAIIMFILAYLQFFGIQIVSTDKNSYQMGETINIHQFSFNIYGCSCSGPNSGIYKYDNGWKKLDMDTGYGQSCVDGYITGYRMGCDVVFCEFFMKNEYDTSWSQTYYEKQDQTNSCAYPNLPNNISDDHLPQVNYPLSSYISKNATPGRYKIKFGISESEFTIN
jgi:hypothetical protein